MAATPSENEYPGFDVKFVSDLYARYRKELREFFVRRGHPQDADDMLQVMFVDLLAQPPPKDLRNAKAYLFAVARTTLHDFNRRIVRHPPSISIDDTLLGGDAEATRRFALWQEDDSSSLIELVQLNRALCELPLACQLTALRRYRDGWTYRQIAEELKVTVHMVKQHVSKSLRHFAEHFGREDPASKA